MPSQTNVRRRRRAAKRRRQQYILWGGVALIAIALVCGGLLWLWPRLTGVPATPNIAYETSAPFGLADCVVGHMRAGMDAGALKIKPISVLSQGNDLLWLLDGATLTLRGQPVQLAGALLESADWLGPRGLRVGDTLDTLLDRLPVNEMLEPGDDYSLLYTADADGLAPLPPYGALTVADGLSQVLLVGTAVSGADDSSRHPCAFFDADPENNTLVRISWRLCSADEVSTLLAGELLAE